MHAHIQNHIWTHSFITLITPDSEFVIGDEATVACWTQIQGYKVTNEMVTLPLHAHTYNHIITIYVECICNIK